MARRVRLGSQLASRAIRLTWLIPSINGQIYATCQTQNTAQYFDNPTFTIVRSQFGSIRFVRLMRARGTIQSLTGGGFG